MRLIGMFSVALIGLSECASQPPTQNACVVAHGSALSALKLVKSI
jgi:hypothetical protein